MGIHDLWLFLLAGFLLNITPGPDMAFIIARSTQLGTRAGVAAALGVGFGAFVHIAAAAIGLSALIFASAWAFTALKWVGAAYLVYIGLQMLKLSWDARAPEVDTPQNPANSASIRQVFLQGALTNVLNPKVAIFFLAFLPQFVDPAAPSKVAAFLTLGLIFNVVGTLWNILVASLAGWFAASRAGGSAKAWLERAIGVVFVAVGIRLALAER
jgi:RhtB (resistance to homoserine/threonine) family protein